MRFHFFCIVIIISGFFFTSCSQPDNNNVVKPKTSPTIIDTSDITVIPFDQNHNWPFKQTYKSTTLSDREIQLIDSLLKRYVLDYNKKLAPNLKASYSIDFEKYKYKRQYMAVLNEKGEKEIWVNGFCNTWNKQWKTEIVLVHDGGNCYFHFKINLTTMKCFELSVNGYA